ncbi:CotH kinase family protein [Neptunicella marina]|uniref:CotH kinase family protein n=1 Tax=Neptunicella marina TaxID=2125989 RepID=A0A8J6M4F5_9ALTE|nr:CotH kinase family protein [Neptunicella marina]MBC3766071.1 CotH kinase family protein [Neptunicella marina]
MQRTWLSFLLSVLLCCTLTACGGSDQKESTPPVVNTPPPTEPPPPSVISDETLPRIDIYALEGEIQNEPKITAKMKVTTYTIGEQASVELDTHIGVEYRGSSSQGIYQKKGYGIETRDEAGEDLSVALLGFPEEEDWVLHGPYGDKSLIRNALMYDLATAFERYVSRYQFVEVYVEEQYQGLYVLLERVKRDSDRIDINKLKEDENEGEDVTGGYILKIDKTTGEHEDNPGAEALFTDDISFISNYGNEVNNSVPHFLYHYPKPEDITSEQKAYIQDYINQFETALDGEQFKDEASGYRHFIQVDSFVDYFLATELSGNIDGYRLSTYLYKDKNAKLSMGPLWDYNLAFGNADYCNGAATDIWIYRSEERCDGGAFPVPFWWGKLLQDPYFVGLVKTRWNQLRESSLSDEMIDSRIQELSDQLARTGAVSKNFERWDVLGEYVWPNYYVGQTYNDELNYLTQWLENRLVWLDSEINQL